MKIVIPAAGAGKRLYPHTYTKPKPMVFVAGKPIIGHILDKAIDLKPEEVVIVVGYMKERLIDYVNENYRRKFRRISYVTQEQQLGLGHSIYVAREAVGDSPAMIALGDMIFKGGYKEFAELHRCNGQCSGSIGVKEIDNPRHYGIVFTDYQGRVKKLVEKPKRSSSRLGIAGVYFIEDSPGLFRALEQVIESHTNGEIQLTDALQKAVENGADYHTFEVNSWYDCGRPESLLEVNRLLLSEQKPSRKRIDHSIVIEPVSIGKNVTIENSIVGPNVSISDGSTIRSSIVEDSIVGLHSEIRHMMLRSSLVGDGVVLSGKSNTLNIGDSSTIEF
ncbi:MAG: Bifunctional protein GlmU [Methanocella sp. PtaU1.Bin125]|nr:MAG: Bifunctional protein GlmU [Methanocella sp. PtaU1.Bin125]